MPKTLSIGIIGVGRWGTNYLRTFNELPNSKVKWICATKDATLREALAKSGSDSNIKATTDYRDILKDEDVDAVAIVSSGSTHYTLAKEALQSGKHVIVEKPIAFHSKDVKELISISNKKNKILMASHLYRFNSGIQKLKMDIDSGLLGKINYVHFLHFGNGPVRDDMGAIWDFFPHSISILLYLLEKYPLAVSANGAGYIQKEREDVATMDMVFPNKIFAASMGSWLYPVKKMNVVVVGEKLYAAFDDYAVEEKLKYYDSRPKAVNGKIIIEDKGYNAPQLSKDKPLTEQLKHFLDCIEKNKSPLTNGNEALKVVNVLEAAQESLEKQGLMVKIKTK